MNKILMNKILAFIISILIFSNSYAAEEGVGMVTGSVTGTYYRFGKDMSGAVAQDGVKVSVKESAGSIDNIKRIDSRENATLGIVQSDVLGFLSRSTEPKSRKIAENLRLIFPFYNEEVHVIARKDIKSFYDLHGKIVSVGQDGSGSWLTSTNLFTITGVQPATTLRISPEEGLAEVLNGRADAMIFVAGKPVKLFENMAKLKNYENFSKMLEGIHFLPMNDERVLKEYGATKITSADYSFVKEEVPTIAVASVLVAHDFSTNGTLYGKARCAEIRDFSSALRRRLGELKQSGHPKWREVNLDLNIGVWQKDKCSTLPQAPSSLEKELLNTIKSR